MCTSVGADVILANLLVDDTDNGVSMKEIDIYCDALRNAIFTSQEKDIDKCIYIDLNSQSISEVLRKYNSRFRFSEYGNRFYKNTSDNKIELDIYNGQYPLTIKNILTETAKTVRTQFQHK